MCTLTPLTNSSSKVENLFIKAIITLIIFFTSFSGAAQESGFLVFKHLETNKVHIVEKGGKVKVKYKDHSGEISKLIGNVSRVTVDSIHLKSGKQVFINDIQSIRIMSRKSTGFLSLVSLYYWELD